MGKYINAEQLEKDYWMLGRYEPIKGGAKGAKFVWKKPTEMPSVGWKPCSERMPDKSGTYLASTNMGDVGLAECDWDYEYGMYWSAEYLDVDAIVAWMELPEPYREDKG